MSSFAPARISDEEFASLCRSTDLRLERTKDGEIRVNPPAGGNSSSGNSEISAQLHTWWKQHRRGRIFDSSGGFRLPDGSTLNPDASYATAEQMKGLSSKDREGFLPFTPVFIIELISYTDRLPIVQQKMLDWMANGALLAWLVNPYKRTVTVYQNGKTPYVFTGTKLRGAGPVEGFVLDLEAVWSYYE